MDASTADQVFKWANFGTTVVVGLYVWLTNRNRVTHARITELQEKTADQLQHLAEGTEKRLDAFGVQLARVDEALEHVPDMAELRAIHERINEVSSMCNQLAGQLGGVDNLLKTIHNHLLTNKR